MKLNESRNYLLEFSTNEKTVLTDAINDRIKTLREKVDNEDDNWQKESLEFQLAQCIVLKRQLSY